MFVDTTIWAAISLWPIVTFHDLELTIMKGKESRLWATGLRVGSVESFEDRVLGRVKDVPSMLRALYRTPPCKTRFRVPSSQRAFSLLMRPERLRIAVAGTGLLQAGPTWLQHPSRINVYNHNQSCQSCGHYHASVVFQDLSPILLTPQV